MEKPWKVVGCFPTLHSRQFASFTLRSEAEQEALTLQKILGNTIKVYAVWSQDDL